MIIGADSLRRIIGDQPGYDSGPKLIPVGPFVFAAAGFTVGPYHDAHAIARDCAENVGGFNGMLGAFDTAVIAASTVPQESAGRTALFNSTVPNGLGTDALSC